MRAAKVVIAAFMIMVVAFPLVPGASAGEVKSENLTLATTSLQTQDDRIFFQSNAVRAFDQVTVACPGTCTVRVEVAAELNIQANDAVQMVAVIDGSASNTEPNSAITSENNPNFGFFGARTFSWISTNLTGSVDVDVAFRTFGSTGQARHRTLTVQVFQQP